MGAVIIGSSGSGPRPARLASALVGCLVAVLALRGLGVVWHNAQGPDGRYLRGFTATGRYYPVDRVCPVLDQETLEDTAGDGGDLTAEATSYEPSKYNVVQGCSLSNSDVTYTFQVVVFPDAASSESPPCAVEDTGDEVETVTDGRYTICRWRKLVNGGALIADDNAVVTCYATPAKLTALPTLQQAAQHSCVGLMDALAHARPAPYWGNRFWTVH
ncbi:MAG TPA: hypothetical protein VN408_06570 [Actinoplanes sp.]|nr:hypothetical protein [Actinoplanes sp.]